MTILLTLLHIVVAFFLIAVVLLQTGKRADLAGAFGGGGSQTAFGARGAATVLSKMTTAAAVLFMLTSIALSIVSSRSGDRSGGSVLDAADDTPAMTEGAPGTGDSGLPTLPPVDDAVDAVDDAVDGVTEDDSDDSTEAPIENDGSQ
jgi:preprotein translocase subunit SecG